MSFHNRLLLNRHVVVGYQDLEVMLLFNPDRVDDGLAILEQVGGRTRRVERSIGYVRATVPTKNLVALVDRPMVDAYQISSLSAAGWYRDGRSRTSSELSREQARAPVVSARPGPEPDRPSLTVGAAHAINRAADRDVGIDEWLSAHPTYDGRGVTIALLESAQPEFEHPAFESAKTLDGTTVPKFAGIINASDPTHPDETRVELNTDIEAVSAWHRVGARTFILPGSGSYWMGTFTLPAGGALVHEFAVLRNASTGEIRVDTDGDADLREETPIQPSTTGIDVQHLHLTSPRAADLAFAVTEGHSPRYVHIYAARHTHQTMTASVAAANRTDGSLAYGVAPGARVLLVRMNPFVGIQPIEGYIDAMQRPDVDMVDDSMGFIMLPDTAADFIGMFMSRLIAAYNKPIVHGAGNAGSRLSKVSPRGDAFAVGGTVDPDTFTALYGEGTLRGTTVHPHSAFGPALDGALKPDFVVPMNRIAASTYLDNVLALPLHAPTAHASGYSISCCTSASSPYAAGVIALLVSAAKQTNVAYSPASLGRALRASARFLEDWPSYAQGAGLVQVHGAWSELQRRIEPPQIEVQGSNAHVLTPYAAAGPRGPGIFEREGWRTGMHGERSLIFTRKSGEERPATYPLTWTGNDGTFEAPSTITLPLHQPRSFAVRVHPRQSGAHSAILNLHDPATDAIIFQTQVAIVAAEPFAAPRHTIEASGTLPLLLSATDHVAVPNDAAAMRVSLKVTGGAPTVAIEPPDGQGRNYYAHLLPAPSRSFLPGAYSLLLPFPTAGVWGLTLTNMSALRTFNSEPRSSAEVSYEISAQILKASVEAHRVAGGSIAVDAANTGSTLLAPALDVSVGSLRTHRRRLLPSGLPTQIAVDVPEGTATLMLKLGGANPGHAGLDMFLYDCTTGECFNHSFTLPFGPAHTFVVRKPQAGQWIAAINSGPFPARAGEFVLEEIITSNVQRHEQAQNVERPNGARWQEVIEMPSVDAVSYGAQPIALIELVDATAERDALAHAWESRPQWPNLAEQSVAIGSAIFRLP